MGTDNELKVSVRDVWEACEAVRAVPMPLGEMAEVRNEAVMDVYTILEQLALERAVHGATGTGRG